MFAVIVVFGMVVAFAGIIVVQQRRARRWKREAALHPIDRSGPRHERAGDSYLRGQITPGLAPGEIVTHQAPCVFTTRGREMVQAVTPLAVGLRRGALVAVTDRRLIVVVTRAGAFGPLLENTGVVVIERTHIARHVFDGFQLSLELHGDRSVILQFQRSRRFGNIDAFWRDVPRILGEWTAPRALP
jgi:hypothetical protein